MDFATATVLTVATAAGVLLALDALAAVPRLVAVLPRPSRSRVVGSLVVAATALAALGRAPARAATPPPMLRVERPVEPTVAQLGTVDHGPVATVAGAGYRVEPGDTLWGIAARTLRDRDGGWPDGADVGRFWRRIYAANRAVIGDDPDLIFPGQQLSLPEV